MTLADRRHVLEVHHTAGINVSGCL